MRRWMASLSRRGVPCSESRMAGDSPLRNGTRGPRWVREGGGKLITEHGSEIARSCQWFADLRGETLMMRRTATSVQPERMKLLDLFRRCWRVDNHEVWRPRASAAHPAIR